MSEFSSPIWTMAAFCAAVSAIVSAAASLFLLDKGTRNFHKIETDPLGLPTRIDSLVFETDVVELVAVPQAQTQV
jgi:hypothetical protein